MTTFSYTTGNPSNLTGGATASMNDIQGPLTDLRTFLNGANQDATNIAAGPTLIATQQAWQTVALTGFPTYNLVYYKDSLGTVHFRGDLQLTGGSPPANGATICTLPAGYRPGVTILLPIIVQSVGGGVNLIQITTAGVITNASGATLSAATNYSFGTCHFRAEN